jgi:uroporphyrinogen-III synthase
MLLIVTRPRAQAAEWVQALQRLGQPAQALPLIEIVGVADARPVAAAWLQLDRLALVVFVSANAVAHFFALAPPGATWPAGVQAGSTGPGTSAALLAAGVPRGLLVEPDGAAAAFDSEALWARLSTQPWKDKRVLVVRGEEGRDWLAEQLLALGAQVSFIAAYARRAPQLDASERAFLQHAVAGPAAHLWFFSSSQSLRNLQALLPAADWSAGRAVASHPRIAQAARDLGFGRVQAVAPKPQAVAECAAAWAAGDGGCLQSAPS